MTVKQLSTSKLLLLLVITESIVIVTFRWQNYKVFIESCRFKHRGITFMEKLR